MLVRCCNFLSSSGVERSAVNRFVVGSNPTWGALIGLQMVDINILPPAYVELTRVVSVWGQSGVKKIRLTY